MTIKFNELMENLREMGPYAVLENNYREYTFHIKAYGKTEDGRKTVQNVFSGLFRHTLRNMGYSSEKWDRKEVIEKTRKMVEGYEN